MAAMTAAPKSLSNLFAPRTDVCKRCNQRVYQVEKVGPVKGVVFHKGCFRCYKCDAQLSMKTYYSNETDLSDLNIYCSKDQPKDRHRGVGPDALGIRHVMNAPKRAAEGGISAMSGKAPQIDSGAMWIRNPMNAQQQYQQKFKNEHEKHHFPAFVAGYKEDIKNAQEELERRQRETEEQMIEVFRDERIKESEKLQQQMDQEWEVKLKDLTDQFDKHFAKNDKKSKRALTMKFEEEKENLKKNMTVRKQNEIAKMTMRLRKTEQAEMAKTVGEHSKQMLDLLKQKEIAIKSELEASSTDSGVALDDAMAALGLPRDLPAPHAPMYRKRDLYNNVDVFEQLDEEVFKIAEVEHASFTELVHDLTTYTYTDLQKARAIFRWVTVKDLNVLDFDKLDELKLDTPIGLLKGIKFGTETYHTLFMRLCSYAGLACVEIKGHSKSVGYEPGMKIREDTFQNTWNAVLIDGDWWPVQCNWGARHLVLNKDVHNNNNQIKDRKKQDKIRYQYDEHYFLTDPDEFIQEFWAQDPEWQLLEKPMTLEEFENIPFVRSVFFHYGLEFEKRQNAVLHTDSKGGTEVKIRVPAEFSEDIVFHYQIRFADRERSKDTEYKSAKLERFVFHSLVDGVALFSVHVPTNADYFLEVFANKIDDSNKVGDDPNATMMPFRLKCACKFKISCPELTGKMHPLPNCASGEWGPSKGARHFGLSALTHRQGVISVENETEVRFQLPRPLHFLCKLRMNNVDDHQLEKFIVHNVHDYILTIRIRPPQPGQYGLDIYARPEDAAEPHTLAHACKYLINCTRVNNHIDVTSTKTESAGPKMAKERFGPSAMFNELGIKTLSHPNAVIEKFDSGALVVELAVPDGLKFSFHFIREPDEDLRERVTFKDNGHKVKFTILFAKAGNYLLAIYARRKKEGENQMQNVYNYMIRYTPVEEDTNSLKKKKGGIFSSKK